MASMSMITFILAGLAPLARSESIAVAVAAADVYTTGVEKIVPDGKTSFGVEALFGSMWAEVGIFLVAFALIRLMSKAQSKKIGKTARPSKKVSDPESEPTLLSEFRRLRQKRPLSGDELQSWAERILSNNPGAFVPEGVAYLEQHHSQDALRILLNVPASMGKLDLVDAFVQSATTQLSTDVDATIACGARLQAHAAAGQTEKALETYAAMRAEGLMPCEGTCCLLLTHCTESRNVEFAERIADDLRQRQEMTFAVYKALMKVYAHSSLFGRACDVYSEVVEAGLEPDSNMYASVIKFAVKAERKALIQDILEKIDFDKVGFDGVRSCMWFVRAAGQEGKVEKAVAIFRKFQELRPALVDTMAFNIVIDACASNRDMRRAGEFLEEMRASGHKMNLVTFNTIMKGHTLLGDLARARAVCKEMDAAEVLPDAASFSCLLSGAMKRGDYKEVWSIAAEIDARGLTPDSYMISVMMQGVKKAENAKEAERFLAILDRPDVRIAQDEVVLNTVLDACINRRDRRRLMRAVDDFYASRVKPGVRTFGLLIKASSILKCTSRCSELWYKMVEEFGLVPNDITLGCMIDALVEAQQVDEALALFKQWNGKVHCDTIIYSTLIKGFANAGDADGAMAVYKDMRAAGVQTNHIVYSSLINAHTRTGLMARAEALLNEMQKEGCQANAITFSSLIKGYCVQSDLEAALRLFHRMVELNIPPDTVIFNTLLDGCVQQTNFDLADELMAEMKRQGVKASNYTLSIVVKMWSKRRNLDKAFACVREALKNPHECGRVDAQVGSCIVGSCIHNRAPERALQVFEEMKSWPNFDGPDANTYSALISGLPRSGYLQRAVELAEEACVALRATTRGQDRRLLAPSALQQLFKALKGAGLLEQQGHPLARKLRQAGMRVEMQWLS